MGSGRHSSDEEMDFDFGFVKNILIVIIILAAICAVIFGTFKLVKKLQDTKTKEVIAEEPQIEYDILGKIVIEKLNIQQPILDSREDEALKYGVIKLYGNDLNKERKFLHSRT